jgi:hypothetical protein
LEIHITKKAPAISQGISRQPVKKRSRNG